MELTHGTEKFVAQVWGTNDTLENKVGKYLIVELNYEQLLAKKLLRKLMLMTLSRLNLPKNEKINIQAEDYLVVLSEDEL